MSTETAPLPSAAVEAMASLEARLAGRTVSDQLAHEASTYVRVSPEIKRAVTRYGVCSEMVDRLSSRESHYMTLADRRELQRAQDERAALHFQLMRAGMLHLIEAAS